MLEREDEGLKSSRGRGGGHCNDTAVSMFAKLSSFWVHGEFGDLTAALRSWHGNGSVPRTCLMSLPGVCKDTMDIDRMLVF